MVIKQTTIDEQPDSAATMKGSMLSVDFKASEVKDYIEITIDGVRKAVINIRDTTKL